MSTDDLMARILDCVDTDLDGLRAAIEPLHHRPERTNDMPIKPATDTLRLLEGGAFLDKASEKLAELVRHVDETGKPGTLTITLALKRAAGAIAVKSTVTAKLPEPKADETLLWATVEGNLTQQNPRQRSLDLQAVPDTKGPVRNVDAETGEIRNAG